MKFGIVSQNNLDDVPPKLISAGRPEDLIVTIPGELWRGSLSKRLLLSSKR